MLSPIVAAGPARLSRLVILCAVLLASVSPVPAGTAHAASGTTATAPRETPPVAGMTPAARNTTPAWGWPIAPPHRIMMTFVAPPTAYAAGHRGIDIDAPAGSPVFAPADGVVYFSGLVVDRPVLSIRHPDGLVSSYEPVASDLRAGVAVHRGDTVGILVAGHCASGCLHFGVRRYGEYVSPLVFLGGIRASVLLPTRRGM